MPCDNVLYYPTQEESSRLFFPRKMHMSVQVWSIASPIEVWSSSQIPAYGG